LKIAITPCPNDTFAFHSLIQKGDISLYDLETLNTIARTSRRFDITKLSTACLSFVLDEYIALPVGATFAEKGGPKLIAKGEEFLREPLAIPGKNSSAYLAFCLLYGVPEAPIEMGYRQILSAVEHGECYGGIVIHEDRFLCDGCKITIDLGTLYKSRFGHMLPLGVIAAKRSLPGLKQFSLALQSSIQRARENVSEYATLHAEGGSVEIVEKHIRYFVTDETEMMSVEAQEAIQFFLEEGSRFGILSPVQRDIVFSL